MSVGMAVIRPAAVVQRAPEMFPAICLLDSPPMPDSVRTLKAPIIPVTVPSSPIIGAIDPMVFSMLIQV